MDNIMKANFRHLDFFYVESVSSSWSYRTYLVPGGGSGVIGRIHLVEVLE